MIHPRYAKHALQARIERSMRVSHTLLKQHLIKSELAWNVHWRASNTHQTRSECIQRACSVRGTDSGRISHTPETRRASRKFLSMFKISLSPNACEVHRDFL